jgi:hypothetical protein
MKSKYDYDTIRDYLHGLLDQETAGKIRELIRTDEVARNIAAGILQLEHEFNGDEHQIEAYIEALRQKQLKRIKEHRPTKVVSFGWVKLAAAILIIAVAGAAVWLMLSKGPTDNDLLAQELVEPYPLMIERGQSDVEAGYKFYLRGEFKKAAEPFGGTSEDVTVVFYSGLSNLYAGDYEKAALLLNNDLLKTSRYEQQASWFCALALVKAGKMGEAKAGLEKIAGNSDHYKSGAAQQLLGSL